jgi:porphobilinogen deaminase
MAREDQERRRRAAEEFRARLEAGDYRGLFGERLNALMAQAAADGGVADELAVLRIVMARLMAEETDPVVLAKAISRVAAVSIQAARAQRAISGQLAESLTDALTSILVEIGAGGGG